MKQKKRTRAARKVRRLVGTIPLPDTLGRRYAVGDWETERDPSGVIVAIAGRDLVLSRAEAARHLNDKDTDIDTLRRRCELLAAELANLKCANSAICLTGTSPGTKRP